VRISTDITTQKSVLNNGSFFGLNSFYNKHQKEITAIAISHVDIIVVRKSEFDQLVELYPNVQEHFDAVVEYYGLLPSFGHGEILETAV